MPTIMERMAMLKDAIKENPKGIKNITLMLKNPTEKEWATGSGIGHFKKKFIR